jgi:pilus assembly protein CpaB
MGGRRILVLLVAVVAAGATAMYARSWIEGQETNIAAVAAPTPDEDVHEVLVADTTLSAGTFVKPQHLRWQRWPTDDVPDSYFLREQHSDQELIGAVVRRGISEGQPITTGGVVKPGERGFLAAVLEPGMRAVSVPLTAISGNAGLIFPGDRVDLILTQAISSDEQTTRRVSETVLSDLRVLAMGVATNDAPEEGDSNEKARTATLQVTPRQAEEVTLLTELGKLSLSLRSLARADEPVGPGGPGGTTYTWDSDVSGVLRKVDTFSNRLLVLRGRKTEDVNVQKGTN